VIVQRLHTRETYPGTGIGLAILKRISDRHGGIIRVETTAGEGATFYFTLQAGASPLWESDRTTRISLVIPHPGETHTASREGDHIFRWCRKKERPVLQGDPGSSCLRKSEEAVSSRTVPTRLSMIRGARSRRPNPTMIAIAAPSPSPTPQAIGVIKT